MHSKVTLPGDVKAILVCSSHWDREWYWPFQAYREKLVRLLDEVTDRLRTPGDLPFFQMDGQWIPIEDYLEIRPERSELVETLVKDGKLRVGPWYTLPDLFLVSGESLVRNLQMGMRRARQMGQSSQVGFVADMFGHNRQMPQIFSLSGLRPAIVWRGLNEEQQPANFLWQAPDGSQVAAYRFGSNVGYAGYAIDVRRAYEPNTQFELSRAIEDCLRFLEITSRRTPAKTLLLFDGGDHLEFLPETLDLVEGVNAKAGRELLSIGTLDDYALALDKDPAARQHVVKGELRHTAKVGEETCLIHGVGSSRVPLKQANHACESLLTLWAEPWAVAAQEWLGEPYPHRALDLAWQYLLRNHPHDSICGCSIDKVHEDMGYRFFQARELAEAHLNRIFRDFSQSVLEASVKPGEIGLTVFTAASAGALRPEIEFFIPSSWPSYTDEFFEYEPKPAFRIFDTANREISYQLLRVATNQGYHRFRKGKFPFSEKRSKVSVCLDSRLSPFSLASFTIRPHDQPTRHPERSLLVDSRTLRNEWLEVHVDADGTLRLQDLKTGEAYSGLLALEDAADIGDGWYRGTALQDEVFSSNGCPHRVSSLNPGPLQAVLNIDLSWELPAGFDWGAMKRARDTAVLRVRHQLILRKDSRYLEIETTLENNLRDHRLRLLFPTDLSAASQYTADAPFDAVTRPIGLPADNHLRRELAVEGTPQQNWLAVTNGSRGLAVIAPGQYESAVLDRGRRPLAVTLLRSFRRAFMTEGNEGGQIQGVHRFRMAVLPIAEVQAARLQCNARALANPPRCVQAEVNDFEAGRRSTPIPSSPLLQVSENVVLSALHFNLDGQLLLRLYNPSPVHQEVEVRTALPISAWQFVDLDNGATGPETRVEPPAICFSMGPWKIQTTLLKVQPIKTISAHSPSTESYQTSKNTYHENRVYTA
jgi:hypothetical protein